MKKAHFYGLLAILAMFLAFASCDHGIGLDVKDTTQIARNSADNNGNERSRRENLARMKTLENHIVSMDELSHIVLRAFNQTVEDKSTIPNNKIVRVNKLPVTTIYRFDNNGGVNNGGTNNGNGNNGNNNGGSNNGGYEYP